MCTITEPYTNWAMNIESGTSSSPYASGRADRTDDSVDSRDISLRSGVAPEELPKGYTPRPADVCCGRGKKNWRHHGNASFRRLIHANVPAYMEATTKHDKTLVVKSIVDVIRSNGGRFLKQTSEGGWYDIGDSQAREKVGHSLRDQVTALSKQKKDTGAAATAATTATPRRSSLASASPYSQPSSRATAATSPSPLNIMSRLPTDLSGILEHIHFPSIESASAPNPLETSSSSLTTTAHQSFNNSSQNFNASLSQQQGMFNFFEPFEDVLEPTPIREVFGQHYQGQGQQEAAAAAAAVSHPQERGPLPPQYPQPPQYLHHRQHPQHPQHHRGPPPRQQQQQQQRQHEHYPPPPHHHHPHGY